MYVWTSSWSQFLEERLTLVEVLSSMLKLTALGWNVLHTTVKKNLDVLYAAFDQLKLSYYTLCVFIAVEYPLTVKRFIAINFVMHKIKLHGLISKIILLACSHISIRTFLKSARKIHFIMSQQGRCQFIYHIFNESAREVLSCLRFTQ